jgi:hypothetical protein
MFPCLPRDRRDQHCVASHPVPRSELVYNLRLTGPEIRTFRAFDLVSSFPIPNLRSGVAESLRLIPEKFPFYRDYRRRLVRSRLPPDHTRHIFSGQEEHFRFRFFCHQLLYFGSCE